MCLLPFPNNFFTKADPSSETGLLVNFTPDAMPRNGTDATADGTAPWRVLGICRPAGHGNTEVKQTG